MAGRLARKPPTGTVRQPGRQLRKPQWRKARAMWIAEQILCGVPTEDIQKALNLKRRSVFYEMDRAAKEGWLDDVRERLRSPLEKAPDVYSQIIEASPEELQKNARGWALKRETLKDLATGLGAFRQESQQTKLVGLAAWHAQRQVGQGEGEVLEGSVVKPHHYLPESAETEAQEHEGVPVTPSVPPDDDHEDGDDVES